MLVTPSFSEYLIPTAMDVPEVKSVIFESRSGDILTRDGLLEVLQNSQALRDADAGGELAPENLPAQPYLINRFDPDTNRTIHGRFLLRPSLELNTLIDGIIGRAQRL